MSDSELNAKIAVIIAVIIGIIALGYVIVFAIAPIFVVASLIDFGFRQKYNQKLDAIKGSNTLNQTPSIHSFDARLVDGRVIIAWLVDLPGNAQLDIYRMTRTGGGTVAEISGQGDCILSTGREFTNDLSEVFYDDGLPEDTYFYIPVVSGMQIKKEPLSYSFLSFAREVQFSTRKSNIQIRGEAARVDVLQDVPKAISDERDEATKLADEVLAVFKERKKLDVNLDAAISRIKNSTDLSDDEKIEAIELMETRAESL
jgi:hypothetical protein